MAGPIRWNNVTINSGAGSAALGNTAANFGRSAVQGLSVLNDQLQVRQDTEDDRLTNEAISSALSGGPQVSDNRRVDATALQNSVQSKGRFDEDLQTSDLTQTGLGLSNTRDQFIVDNQEEVFKLDADAKRLGMDADSSNIALNKFKTSVAKYDFDRTKKINLLDDTQRTNVNALGQAEQGLEDQYVQQLAQEEGLVNPTQDQINAYRVTARARVQGPEGRQALRQEMVRLGASEAAWELSAGGRRDALTEATEAALTKTRQERREVRIERLGEFEVFMEEDNFSLAIKDQAGNMVQGSEQVLEAQKDNISNPGKALQFLNRNGVNIANLDDDDKELIEQVRDAFPTSSLFTPVVKGWVDARGNLDQSGLRNALKTGQRDILLAKANLNTPQQVGSSGSAGADSASSAPTNSTEGLVQQFRDVQTRVNEAGNLPANIREAAMKAFEGKVSKGGKSVLSESVRRRNLEVVEEYLDNKESRDAAKANSAVEKDAQDARLDALNRSLNGGAITRN